MVLCFCGKMAIVRTAWTDKNPGRRFWGFPTEVRKYFFFGFQHKSPITCYDLLLFLKFWRDPNVDLLGGLMVQFVNVQKLLYLGCWGQSTNWSHKTQDSSVTCYVVGCCSCLFWFIRSRLKCKGLGGFYAIYWSVMVWVVF